MLAFNAKEVALVANFPAIVKLLDGVSIASYEHVVDWRIRLFRVRLVGALLLNDVSTLERYPSR